MESRLRSLGHEVAYIGRDASSSPATGSRNVHLREQAEIVEAALTGDAPHIVHATPAHRPLARRASEGPMSPDGNRKSDPNAPASVQF
jgi:hypothetical protein